MHVNQAFGQVSLWKSAEVCVLVGLHLAVMYDEYVTNLWHDIQHN